MQSLATMVLGCWSITTGTPRLLPLEAILPRGASERAAAPSAASGKQSRKFRWLREAGGFFILRLRTRSSAGYLAQWASSELRSSSSCALCHTQHQYGLILLD